MRILGVIDAVFIFGLERRTLHDLLAGTRVVTAKSSRHVYTK